MEKEADLLSQASGHNSGIACTGVDAEIGSIERALIRESVSCLKSHLETFNLPYRPMGSLVCDWGDDANNNSSADKLQEVVSESNIAGDSDVCKLSNSEVLNLEPNINPKIKGAVHIHGETIVDPW